MSLPNLTWPAPGAHQPQWLLSSAMAGRGMRRKSEAGATIRAASPGSDSKSQPATSSRRKQSKLSMPRRPNTYVVMHASSSVSQKLREIFTQFGGEMRETYGVQGQEIRTRVDAPASST